jgi:hypothetical protein
MRANRVLGENVLKCFDRVKVVVHEFQFRPPGDIGLP